MGAMRHRVITARLRIQERWLPWVSLTGFGNSRLVRSSLLWLAVVPVVAKVMAPLPDRLRINDDAEILLRLPFSWKVLFLAALLYALGTLLYLTKCPRLIRLYSDYGQLSNAGVTPQGLSHLFTQVLRTVPKPKTDFLPVRVRDSVAHFIDAIQWQSRSGEPQPRGLESQDHHNWFVNGRRDAERLVSRALEKGSHVQDIVETMRNLECIPVDAVAPPGAYWAAHEVANFVHPWARVLVAMLFAMGTVLMGWIMALNVWYVVTVVFVR